MHDVVVSGREISKFRLRLALGPRVIYDCGVNCEWLA